VLYCLSIRIPKFRLTKEKKMILTAIQGFCMALADSVPGVSGGTIAFIMGFYDRFIGSIEGLFFGKLDRKISSAKFLINLGAGWVVGMLLSVTILSSVFNTHIYDISSLFLGFIIGALPVIYIEEKESIKGKYRNIPFLIGGMILVAALSYFNPTAGSGVDISQLTVPLAAYIFVSGMAAISAMFLPGISGSTILLILGLYIPVIAGLHSLTVGDFSTAPALAVFVCGIVAGAMTVVKIIKRCLDRYRSETVYAILGLMIGSIYAVVVGPESLNPAQPAMTWSTFSLLYFVIGAVIIGMFQWIKVRMAKK
jgi:putative membrane protein